MKYLLFLLMAAVVALVGCGAGHANLTIIVSRLALNRRLPLAILRAKLATLPPAILPMARTGNCRR